MLVNKLGFRDENIRLLIDSKATKESIRIALYSIARLAKNNDRVLIYFSGHGQTITSVESNDMKIGYLIPVNGDLKDPVLNSIAMDEILLLCQSECKHMLFLMDACYSGLMAKAKGMKIFEDNDDYIHSKANISARQIITAGSAEQISWESGKIQHGIFTLNVLKSCICLLLLRSQVLKTYTLCYFLHQN